MHVLTVIFPYSHTFCSILVSSTRHNAWSSTAITVYVFLYITKVYNNAFSSKLLHHSLR